MKNKLEWVILWQHTTEGKKHQRGQYILNDQPEEAQAKLIAAMVSVAKVFATGELDLKGLAQVKKEKLDEVLVVSKKPAAARPRRPRRRATEAAATAVAAAAAVDVPVEKPRKKKRKRQGAKADSAGSDGGLARSDAERPDAAEGAPWRWKNFQTQTDLKDSRHFQTDLNMI